MAHAHVVVGHAASRARTHGVHVMVRLLRRRQVMRLLGRHVHLLLLLQLLVVVHHLLDLRTVAHFGRLVQQATAGRVHQAVVFPFILHQEGTELLIGGPTRTHKQRHYSHP